MPELPEVETLRRNLERTLVGRTFMSAQVTLAKLFAQPPGLDPSALLGRRVARLRRRAKFLLVDLDGGLTMAIHLRLTGQLVHQNADGRTIAEGGHPVPAFGSPLPHKATHAIFTLDDGSRLFLTDIRQFGRAWLLPESAVADLTERAGLGPEPLGDEFTFQVFRERLARRSRALLKPLLLDQGFVGGVGNIYADEIIFAAGLSPATRPAELRPAQTRRLYEAIHSVLTLAVEEGVAEILNGRANPDRDFPRVHGREGQPCPRCGTTIAKIRFGGRGTYVCPKCQRASTLIGSAAGRAVRATARAPGNARA